MTEEIVRIAARGDGVTSSGRYASFAVPGDRVLDDGTVEPGPHHQVPPCRHFPECGGCQLQHADDTAYQAYLIDRVNGALAQHGLKTEIRKPHLSPPRSRRRGNLKALKLGKRIVLGFNEAKSNRIVDCHECHILRPELFALIAPLRALLANQLSDRRGGEAAMTLIDGGVDLLLRGIDPQGYEALLDLTDFAEGQGVARLSIDRGLGPETLYEPQQASVTLSGRAVSFPPNAFLQATADGEAALVAAATDALGDSARIADLFAGLGTFALAVGAVFAAEASRDAAQALQRAALNMKVEHRDLYRRPLDGNELASFDGVVLDPPRAGAEEQVRTLAASTVDRIAYISCNPATFARDARILAEGGYTLDWVKPVGQFRWSTHVELCAAVSR